MRFNKGITLFSCFISLIVVLRRIQGCFTDTTAMCGRIGIQLIWSWTYNDRIDDRVNIALRRSSGLKWKQTIRSEMNILIFFTRSDFVDSRQPGLSKMATLPIADTSSSNVLKVTSLPHTSHMENVLMAVRPSPGSSNAFNWGKRLLCEPSSH